MLANPTNLLSPHQIEVQSIGPRCARITLEPLDRGFGHTLGNALRRVLLSSLPGCAVTEVTIENVLHEYTTIPGVQEDVTDILLNLKGLAIRMHAKDEAVLTLNKKGTGAVLAGDVTLDHDVEIVNPGHHIATLIESGELHLTLKLTRSRGYAPATIGASAGEEGQERTIGRLRLDASFSPVRRVSYEVQNARVEQRTDLDKLIMEVETNGAIEPQKAIRDAAHILQGQLAVFLDLAGAEPLQVTAQELDLDPYPVAFHRRPGAHRAFRQLSQGREHLFCRGPDPAHRGGADEDPQPRQEIADGDQRRSRHTRSLAGDAAHQLAAAGATPAGSAGPGLGWGMLHAPFE